MSDTAFPNGFISDGVWGTDISTDTTVGASGGTSFKFPSGGADVSLWSAWATSDSWDGNNGALPARTVVYAVCKASSSAAGDDIGIDLEYTSDFATFYSTTVYSGPIPSTTGWHACGKNVSWVSAGKWCRLRVYRPTNRSFNLWVDRIYFGAVPGSMMGQVSATGGSFAATWQPVANVATSVPFSQCRVSSDVFYADAPGIWYVSGTVSINDSGVSDGDLFGCRLKVVSTLLGTDYVYGNSLGVPVAYDASTNWLSMTAGPATCTLDVGDTVTLEVIQYAGTSRDYINAQYHAVRVTAEN